MNVDAIVTQALERLNTITAINGNWNPVGTKGGKEGTQIDGTIDLYVENVQHHLFIEVKRELRNYQLQTILEKAKNYRPLMIVAEHIFPALKEELRKNNIGYLDTAGNIYLKTPQQLIWLDGQDRPKQEKKITNRAFTKTGLKAVFYFLTTDEIINFPYRVMADMTGVALGNIKNIIDGLKEAGFILNVNNKKMMLCNRKALLDRWIAGYGETLKPALKLGSFRFGNPDTATNWQTLAMGEKGTVWGGEPAAEVYTDYLRPALFTVYTIEPKINLMNRWRLIPDAQGNVEIYERFWNENTVLGKMEHPDRLLTKQNSNIPLTHPLLVYADLVLTNDLRCLETAKMIYTKYLKNEFDKY